MDAVSLVSDSTVTFPDAVTASTVTAPVVLRNTTLPSKVLLTGYGAWMAVGDGDVIVAKTEVLSITADDVVQVVSILAVAAPEVTVVVAVLVPFVVPSMV